MYPATVSGLRSQLASAELSAALASSDASNARRDATRQRAAAADERVSGAIHEGAAAGFASVVMELRSQLMSSNADRDRLQDRVDDLVIERSALIAHCASLLAENDALRARSR
jgi:hypothetical protein